MRNNTNIREVSQMSWQVILSFLLSSNFTYHEITSQMDSDSMQSLRGPIPRMNLMGQSTASFLSAARHASQMGSPPQIELPGTGRPPQPQEKQNPPSESVQPQVPSQLPLQVPIRRQFEFVFQEVLLLSLLNFSKTPN